MKSNLNQFAKIGIFAFCGGLVTEVVAMSASYCLLAFSCSGSGKLLALPSTRIEQWCWDIGEALQWPSGLAWHWLDVHFNHDETSTFLCLFFIQAFLWSALWWIVLWINRPEDADPQAAVEPRE
jgi:hypothetical protein